MFPTLSNIIDRILADIKSNLPSSLPFTRNSRLRALGVAVAGRIYEIYQQLNIIKRDAFVVTAQGTALEDLAYTYGITRLAGTGSSGSITITGVSGSTVSLGDSYLSSDNGLSYTVTTGGTLASYTPLAVSLAQSGGVATGTTSVAHNLGTGMTVTIYDCTDSDYDKVVNAITVTGEKTFTYNVPIGATASGVTGEIFIGTTTPTAYLVAPVTCSTLGEDGDLSVGAFRSTTTPLLTAYVDYEGISGGTDAETDEELRARLLQKTQNPNTPFNTVQIETTSRQESGVTRVWSYTPSDNIDDLATLQDIIVTATTGSNRLATVALTGHGLTTGMWITVSDTADANLDDSHVITKIDDNNFCFYVTTTTADTYPATITPSIQLGQTQVFFVRDNDDTIFPNATQVSAVKSRLDAIRPASMSTNDLFVNSPFEKSTDFTFSSLSPNTDGIITSITNSLNTMFDKADVGDTITQNEYIAAIQTAYDIDTGEGVESFVLSSPSSNLTSNYNELLTLGTVTA